MPRRVFFSFHYQRDIRRVQIVKNHHITKGNYTAAGFFDGSLEEKAKREGDAAVKSLILKGFEGCTVLCVLIGNETYTRRWVHYEILKAAQFGMGIFGIRIHKIRDPQNGGDVAGVNPFDCMGYGQKDSKLRPMIHYANGWADAPDQNLIKQSDAAPYLDYNKSPILSSIFNTYDWVDNDGYSNFSAWVERAARQAQL